jgi:hypothetical protein
MKSKEVPLELPSGFARRRNEILGGLVFLTLVYGVTYFLLRDSVSSSVKHKMFIVSE